MSPRSLRDAATAAVLATAVAACSGSPSAPAPAPTGPPDQQQGAAAGTLDVDWSRVGGEGFVYLQVNTDGRKHHELLRVDLRTGDAEQVTDVPGPFGISAFSVSSAGLVVAEASQQVDHLARVEPDGTLTPLRPSRGSAPTIDDRGSIALLRPRIRGVTVDVRSAEGQWRTATRELPDFGTVVWSRPGRLVAITPGHGRTTWSTFAPDGSLDPGGVVAEGHYLPTGEYGTHDGLPIVLSRLDGGAPILWRPGRRPRLLPAGWRDGCISPDGEQLLLLADGRLGVLPTDDLDGPVRVIGSARTDVIGCGWVEERFGP